MSDESAAVEQAPAEMPAPAEPIEGRVIPPAAPESARAEADDAETGRSEGIPAGHLAAGGLSASAVALGSLYQLLGLSGLIGGGVLAAGGGIAYARRRYSQRDRRTWGVSWEDGQPTRGPGRRGRRSGGGDVLGGLRSEGRSSSRSGGRRSPSGGSRATGGDGNVGGTSAGRGGRRFGGGSASTTDGHGAGGRGSAGGRSAGHSGSPSGRSGRTSRRGGPLQAVGQVAATTGRAAREVGRAASWVDRKTGRRVSRAARATASKARKAAVWADRKTGRRVSSAYRAATTGRAKGFRARRRRAAAVLGWHGPLTAPVIALMAVLAEWWRTRKTRTAETENTEDAAGTTSETSAAGEDTTTPAEDDGDSALPGDCDCPRCGRRCRATIPADEQEITITCPCGFTITFYRAAPDDPPDEGNETNQARASTGSDRRRPHTAPTTTYTRRNTMSANPLAAAAAELNAVAAAHAPVDMWQVARELDQLPEVPANVGMALRTYTVRLQGEYPIHPAVVEALGELYIAHAQLVAAAESIGPLFRQVHAEDLRREEAPRINEQAWNV